MSLNAIEQLVHHSSRNTFARELKFVGLGFYNSVQNMCNELGVCQGPISHNNEQTQSVEGII